MTIHHESEIVATRYDAQRKACVYVVERDGRRWTVEVPLADLEKLGPLPASTLKRREAVAHALEYAMRGPADGEAPGPGLGRVE